MNTKRLIFLMALLILSVLFTLIKNNFISSFFAGVLFFVVPFLIGETYASLISNQYFERNHLYKYFLFCWLTGAVSIFLISTLLYLLHIFNMFLVTGTILLFILISLMLKREYPRLKNSRPRPHYSNNLQYIIFCLL